MIKLICSDIDGTLVPDGTDKINPEIFKVIRELKRQGTQFVAASGRQYESLRQLFLPVVDEIIFAADGGNVIMEKGELISVTKMEPADAKELLEEVEKIPRTTLMLGAPRTSYIQADQPELIEWMDKGYHFNLTVVENIREGLKNDIVKISLYDSTSHVEEIAEQYISDKWFHHERIKAAYAGTMWLDFVSRKGGKGGAIQYIQNRLFATPEETMAFGDNQNDLEMLAFAKHSFAVGNARQEVKDAAKYVADTNVNDGVLKELKKYLEKRKLE